MSNTKIKAAQFSGVVGNGVNGYILQSSGNGDMEWVASITPPAITSLSYPGSATAADPAGGETVTITGTDFASGATVTVGGTAAPAVSFVSATTLTITTPAKAAGDYDVVVTNTDTGSATFINGISYNGIPAWSTAAGSLGTFASAETISTITLAATERPRTMAAAWRKSSIRELVQEPMNTLSIRISLIGVLGCKPM